MMIITTNKEVVLWLTMPFLVIKGIVRNFVLQEIEIISTPPFSYGQCRIVLLD